MDITREEYEKNYGDRLASYIDKWVDNSPTSFLEIELKNYNDYCSSLIKISDYFKNNSAKDLRVESATKDVISGLKDINEPVFNEIFTIEKTNAVTDKVELDNGYEDEMIRGFIPGRIEIDFTKLNNYITSAKRILGYINDKKLGVQNSGAPEKQKNSKATEINNKSDKKEEPKDVVENNYTKSAIEDHLFDIKDDIKPDQYKILVDALYSYFTTGKFPKLKKKIMFKTINKKKVGWSLKKVYKDLKTDKLNLEYLQFAKDNINLFEKYEIKPDKFTKSPIYKYFTTNPYK